MALAPDPDGVKFGPFWLTPGISRGNAFTFFFSAFMFVTLVTFLNFVQPYLLNEVLRIPAGEQGKVTGLLNVFHECTALLLMGVAGSVSDRFGRRTVGVIGLIIIAGGLFLFPQAETITQLYMFRVIVAVGVAIFSVMVIATMQDYPQEVSRGKWGGTNTFITSFAVLLVAIVLSRIPGWLEQTGFDANTAGRYTFWLAAGAALLTMVVIRIGWYGGRFADASESTSPFAGIAEGLNAARRNPRLALAYIAGFAARGDLVVIGAFFSLWFVRAGADQGIESSAALGQAGITLGALTLATWIWAPTFGWIIDRISRVSGLAVAMGLAAIGYFALGQVDNPFDMKFAIPATMLLGVGEVSAIIAGNALLGQEAPARIRGAAVGVFSLVGTFGILFATFVGGLVFDSIGYGAPFTMMAVVNLVVAIVAVVVAKVWGQTAKPQFGI